MHVRLFGKVGHLLHYTTLYGSWDVQLEATFSTKEKNLIERDNKQTNDNITF